MGIDYGMGQSNIDTETGIRYGIISQHSIAPEAFSDAFVSDYGEPTCPKCGNPAEDVADPYSGEVFVDPDTNEEYERACGGDEYVCHECKYVFDSSDAFPDEPLGWSLDDGEYKAIDCLDSDIIIIKSPYYTLAPFCSPCVPGAGNLDGASGGGEVRAYCFDASFFDGGKAPYRVFRVSDDAEVAP